MPPAGSDPTAGACKTVDQSLCVFSTTESGIQGGSFHMTREERKRRRAGRLRFWIMLAACLIVTVAAASTMVQAAAGAPSLRQRNICRKSERNAQRAALADLYKEWEDGNN